MTNIQERDATFVWHPFTQHGIAAAPIEVVSAELEFLNTKEHGRLVDMVSSWWVTLHGHAHPKIAQAIAEQARTLEHVIFAGCTHAAAVDLAAALVSVAPAGLQRVFYSDNGSTSVEVALKMALQYWQNRGQEQKNRIVAFRGGYHGDTVGSMSVGAECGFFDKFRRMFFPVDFVSFPETWLGDEGYVEREKLSLLELESLASQQNIAAIILEPLVQGASGMRMCRPEFLRTLRDFSDRVGALLIFDEVMTGFGRTGSLFASERAAVSPDLLCLSKGITGGFLPLAVTMATAEIYEAFLGASFDRAFVHGHSYTANPISCAAALASLEVFKLEQTLHRVSKIEAFYHLQAEHFLKHPKVKTVRVLGGIFAMDLDVSDPGYSSRLGPEVRKFFLNRGLLLRPLGNTLYFMPPFCVSEDSLQSAFAALRDFLQRDP
jgi:adenosylmethionine-8-amino-7-oxononanoate aminotransferase